MKLHPYDSLVCSNSSRNVATRYSFSSSITFIAVILIMARAMFSQAYFVACREKPFSPLKLVSVYIQLLTSLEGVWLSAALQISITNCSSSYVSDTRTRMSF